MWNLLAQILVALLMLGWAACAAAGPVKDHEANGEDAA